MTIEWTQHIWFTNERQKLNGFDTDGCEFFSFQESIDAQMDILLQFTGQSVIDQFTAMGFMDTGADGNKHFHSSARFIEVMSGVGVKGSSSEQVFATIQKYGILPWTDLPFDTTITPTEYFAPISIQLKAKAIQAMNLIGGSKCFRYNTILNDGTKDVAKIAAALPNAPVCLGIAVSAFWNQPIPGDPAPGALPEHEVMCYDVQGNNLLILDHYDPPLKTLDIGYPVHYASQILVMPVWQVQQEVTAVLNSAQAIIPQVPPAQGNIIEQAIQSLIAAFKNWANDTPLSDAAPKVEPEISTHMNYSLFKSRTFWTLVAGFAYNVWQLCAPSVSPSISVVLDAVFTMLASYFHLQTGQSTTGANAS